MMRIANILVAAGAVAASMFIAGCGNGDAAALEAEMEAKLEKERKLATQRNDFLLQRMTDLEAENRKLEEAFAALKASQEVVVAKADSISNQVASELDVQVQDLIATKIDEKIGEDAGAGPALASTIQGEIVAHEERKAAEREAERERQRREWEERRAKEREERFQSLVADLGLNTQQAQQLQVAQQTFRSSMEEMWTEAREGGNFDRDSMREKMEGLRAAHEQILGQFMNEEQLAAYNERNGGRGSFFGGRGGRGPGGGR